MTEERVSIMMRRALVSAFLLSLGIPLGIPLGLHAQEGTLLPEDLTGLRARNIPVSGPGTSDQQS